MKIWSTFRYVPPVAPEALAWCVLSFAACLAAYETAPTVMGQPIAPLALALAVQMTLMLAKNVFSDRAAHIIANVPLVAGAMIMAAVAGFGLLALHGTDAFAAQLMIAWMLFNAFCLTWANAQDPDIMDCMPSAWSHLDRHRDRAILIEAGGFVLSAAALLSVWTFAGPLAFAVMMGFGVVYVRMLTNWIVVLHLLDLEDQGADHTD